MKTIYIAVPGIKALGIFQRNWIDDRWSVRLATDCCLDRDDAVCGVDFDYTAGPITKARGGKERAERLSRIIFKALRHNNRVILVCHSNGANVVENALKVIDKRILIANPIYKCVFIASALKGDFSESSIYGLYKTNCIGEIDVHVGGKDHAMWFAKAGRFLGYGNDLGTMQSREFRYLIDDGSYYYEKDWGHSDFFNDQNWSVTKERILR